MISIPANDPVGALMPHSVKAPIEGRKDGPLAGLSFMVKDLLAIAGLKVSNGNPDVAFGSCLAMRGAAMVTTIIVATIAAPTRCRRSALRTGPTLAGSGVSVVVTTRFHSDAERADRAMGREGR